MPLDPKLLAALTAKSSSYDPSKVNWGDASEAKGAWNLGQGIIDILSTGGYASAGVAKKIGENVSSITKGDMGGLADLLNPLSVPSAAAKGVSERQTYAPLLENVGVDKNVAPWLGLALDIGLDPLTYVSGGTIAGLKGIPTGIRVADAATKLGGTVLKKGVRDLPAEQLDALSSVEKVIEPATAPLTASQKMGNYLAGITRGYEFNKSAYGVQQLDRKLAKAAAKEAKKSGDTVLAETVLKPVIKNVEDVADPNAMRVGLLTKRNELLGLIEGNKSLSNKFAKLADKAEAASAVAFSAPKAGKVAEPVATAAAKAAEVTPETPKVDLEAIDRQERFASARLKGLLKKEQELNNIVRQLEDPRKQGGVENYATGLRPLVSYSANPKDPSNLVAAIREVNGKFRPAVGSKLDPAAAPNFVGKKVYETEAEAQAAATAHVEKLVKKSGVTEDAGKIAELSAQVEERIAELADYAQAAELGMKGVDPAKLTLEKLVDAIDAEMALGAKLEYIEVDLPAKGFDELAKAINFINSSFGKKVTADDLDQWAEKVNQYLSEKDIPGFPVKAGDVTPSDFWAFGDLLYVNRDGSIVVNKEVKIAEKVKAEEEITKNVVKAIETEKVKAKKEPDFYARLGKDQQKFRDAEATFLAISKGELTGDANKALAVMQKIAPTYEFAVKTLPNGKTLVTKNIKLEPANVAPIFKQGALGIPSPASILQGAKAKTITLGQLARATKAPGKVGEEAKAFFTKAKQQLVEAKRKPVRTWEEMFADKAGVDFLINRVIPESADPEIFAKAKEFLKATLNQTDEIPNPDQLSEIFQEFLSGRNPLAAIRDGKIDVGLYIEPTSTKFKNVSELIDALTGPDQIELSVDSMNKLASALKINPDPTATRAELVLKSTIALFEARKDAEAAVGALRAMFESKGVNASVENALATAGVTDQAAVAAVAKEGVDVVEELGTQIDNAIESMTDGSPAADYVPNALVEKAMGLREQYALEFLNVTEDIAKLGISSPLALVMPLALRGFGSEALRKISLRAEKAGISTEEYITKLVSGEVDDIKRDPSLLMDPTAVRLDALNTEARMDFFGDAWKAAKRNFGKGQRAGQDFRIAEESLSLKAIESVFRSMGIPVRVQENYGMRLLRAGLKQGDKLPESFAPLVSNVTYADIASLAHNTGATEIFRRLRFPKSGQNVMPSQFEYAFLTLKQVSEKGSPVPGTPEWDKVRKAFDTKYDAKAHAMIPADHVSGGMKAGERVAPSKDVNAGIDNAIAFMVEKLDILKGIDAQRAGIELAHTNAEVLDSGSRLYGALLRFSMMRSKFTGGLADLGKFNAYEGGINNIPGTAELFTEFSKFADALSVGKFRDAELATKMADAITNMLMFTKSGKNAGLSEQISKELRVIVPTLKNQMRERLMMGEATKGKPKVSETQIQKAKGNRRKAAAEANAEVENMTAGAIQNVEERVLTEAKAAEDAAAKGAKLPEDKSTVSTNLIAGNIDPTVAKLEMAADTMMKHGAMTLLGDNFLTKFSGTYGMGKEVKTIVAGIEEMNISSVQMFGSALKKLAVKYDRDIPAINAAFRFIQKWGKENYDAAELEAAAVDFTEWLSRQNTAGVNLDIVADLKHFVDSLFGDAGTMSGVIHRPVFARELDQAFGAQGLRDIKDGTGFIVPVDSGPELLKWSWAKSEVADDAKFNSLQVMHRYAAAMHAASTKLGIADSFTHFFGRTAAQIKEEGLNMADFFKVDPNAASGRSLASVLDENVYYSKAELDKLRYLEQYIMYDKTFQDSTKRIVDFSDRIVHVLKASHTTWRLGHHVTTVVGEYIMNILDGVVSTAYYENGRRILTKFDPSQYTNDPNVFKAYEMSNVQQGMQLKAEKFDSVGFLNRKGQRVLLSDDAVHALADRFGVLVKPGSSVEDFISSDPTFGKNFFGPISSVNEKIVKFSSSRDNFFRMAHFIKELEKGGLYDTAEEAALYAARRVHEYHPTVGSLSAFEKKYMRRIVFFYTWQRLAATKVFSLMLEQPGIVVIPSKIQYAFAEYNGFNPESFGDPWDPNGMYASYNTGSTYGPQFAGPQGAADAWGFQPAVPQLDILNSLFQGFTVQPGQSAADVITSGSQQLFGRNLSPLPKWFVELTSGEQVGGGKITSLNEYAINQVGGLNTLSKLTGIGQDPETQKTQAELDESRQRVGLNLLLGQKLNDYTTGAALNRYQQDQADIRKREAEAAFGSKPPTATY